MNAFQKRLFALYLGGVVNAYIGLFLLIEGLPMFDRQYTLWAGIAFVVFALVDFVFPVYLRAQALRRAAANGQPRA
jgi:multidrug transporter EmrE-like cation transporter